MLQQIIDRREAGKNKSIGNRERFLQRHKGQIREAVRRAIDGRGIRDIAQGEDVHLPRRDIREPVFGHGQGGRRETIHPGNQEYVQGDKIARPKGSGQGAGGQAADSGEGEDDFVFHLSKEEFMQVFFDDLALPNMARTALAEAVEFKTHRAGYTSDGTPNNLHVVRSLRGAIGRRIGVGGHIRADIQRLTTELEALQGSPCLASKALLRNDHEARLVAEITVLRARLDRMAYIDPIDLRYRGQVKTPAPTAKAVMFCLMDVSGSMDEQRKDLAKRFFILLHLFLTRHYEKIDIVFIRHHTQADEVDENTFFHSAETGGTVASSALVLMDKIVRERYAQADWNVYGAQASDGDNWNDDSPRCRDILSQSLLPLCRYFAYIQVVEEEQSLWREYADLASAGKGFAVRKATAAAEIYPVFRDLFKKEGASA